MKVTTHNILKNLMQAKGMKNFFNRVELIRRAVNLVLPKMSTDAWKQSCINLPRDFDETKRKRGDDEASSHAKKKRKMDNDDDVVVIDLTDDDDEKSDTVAPSGDEEAYDSGSHSPPMPGSPLLPPPYSPPQSPQASPKRERDDEVVDMPQSKKIKMDDASVVDKSKSSEELPGLVNDLAEGMGAKQWKRERAHWNPELLEQYEFRVAQTEDEAVQPGVFLIKNLDPEQVWNNDCGCKDLMHYFDFTASFRDKAVYCTAEANNLKGMVDDFAADLDKARDELRDGINRWLKYMCSPQLGWTMSTMPCDDYLQLRYMLLSVDWIFPELKKRGKLFKKFNEVWQERHDDLKAIRRSL